MTTRNRQLLMGGVVKDRAKSVPMPQTRSHNALVPQKGIAVGTNWKVAADEMNVILYHRRKSKTGRESWQVHGYYSTIGGALIAIVRQGVRDTELRDLQAIQDKIVQLERDILRMAAGR